MPVLKAIIDCYQDAERLAQNDPEDYPIWGYAAWNQFRDPLAAFVGCKRDELALVRNATEANSYIANGVDLKAGDEVLITDQEHPGGEHPWDLRAKRYGIVVKKIMLPKPVPDAATVLNLFSEAITARTRVIFFSHIPTVTGVVLPAKELCALARSKSILSAVDGAHVPGMMRLNLRELGCDATLVPTRHPVVDVVLFQRLAVRIAELRGREPDRIRRDDPRWAAAARAAKADNAA